MSKFKKGDKVKLDPSKCTDEDIKRYSSTGAFGITYVIQIVTYANNSYDYYLKGSNWHKESWLMTASLIRIGGE